jgi:tRNA 2-thiouridine synthesizing protein B
MLHLIFVTSLEVVVLDRIGNGDAMVFMESAVLRTLKNSISGKQLAKMLESSRAYVLADQLTARGISVDELVEGVEIIHTVDLVDLCVKYPVIHSWT